LPIHSTAYIDTIPSLALDRLYNCSPSLILTAIHLGVSTIPTRRLNTPTLNPNYTGDTYYNYSKIGHRLLDYT